MKKPTTPEQPLRLLSIPSLPAGAIEITTEDSGGDKLVWKLLRDRLWYCTTTGAHADYIELITKHEPLEVTGWAEGYGPAVWPSVETDEVPQETAPPEATCCGFPQGVAHEHQPPVAIRVDRPVRRNPLAGLFGAPQGAEDGGLVYGPGEDTDPRQMRDCDGREIRPGFKVVSIHAPDGDEYEVIEGGRYQGGEANWRWMVMLRLPGAEHERCRPARQLRVVDPPADAPEHGTTDELLHRLRELVSTQQQLAGELAGETGPEWARVFDELDYRMTHPGYSLPGPWAEQR